MELSIVKQGKNKLVLEIKGESHTFCNVLKTELWNDKHVTVASYNISHPLEKIPFLTVETDGDETPQAAISAAAKRISKDAEKFKDLVTKNLK